MRSLMTPRSPSTLVPNSATISPARMPCLPSYITVALALLGWLVGCGPATEPPTNPELMIAPPLAITAPTMGPCAEGWTASFSDDIMVCEPDAPRDCGPGQVAFIGDRACHEHGVVCPSGQYAEAIPSDADVLYVSHDAVMDGDGSHARPFASIASALGAASPNTIVAIGRGIYAESLRVTRDAILWGACPAETRIVSPTPEPALHVVSGTTEVRNLSFEGGSITLLTGGARTRVLMEGITITNAEHTALGMSDGAAVEGRGVVIAKAEGQGIVAVGGAHLHITQVEISDTGPVLASDPGTEIVFEKARFSSPRIEPTTGRASALSIRDGAKTTLLEGIIEGTVGIVALVGHSGSALTIDRVVVRGSTPDFGLGLWATESGSLDVRRTRLDDSAGNAISVFDDAHGTLSDVVILRTTGQLDDEWVGSSIYANRASIAATRVAILGGQANGVTGHNAAFDLEDVEIRDLLPIPGDSGDSALAIWATNSTLTADRLRISRVENAIVAMASDLTIHDLTIEETGGRSSNEVSGMAIVAAVNSRIALARVSILRPRSVGIFAEERSEVVVTDARISQTMERYCADGCGDASFGFGLIANREGRITAERFEIVESALACAQIAEGGQMDLQYGILGSSPFGINVQDADYDLRRVSSGVRYVEIAERNIDRSGRRVPAPTIPMLPSE